MFKPEKVAQVAAYLLRKEGRPAPYMKLLKLMYLADRESVRLYGDTLSGDRLVSMPHGPVLSLVYELMNGAREDDHWSRWIAARTAYDINTTAQSNHWDLDELSGPDREILDQTYARFGAMSQWDLRDWTHKNCQEWEDPNGSSFDIKPEKLFLALGVEEKEASERAEKYRERRSLDRVLSRYR
ncbi:Panacea domain-containing protein [Dyella sp. BiH032]|uniref:Panacea domain-containing protein n=1 Tax=Dyella sp. BiH032 TaxID=3075430 RepID=UPI002892BA99|nr:Panacea domain-containing protein [Dyella sp. BiH032]WNL45634.1 Panacea domain-containing protein [Dyella sp. BiH032]